jgi:hypothetical protein
MKNWYLRLALINHALGWVPFFMLQLCECPCYKFRFRKAVHTVRTWLWRWKGHPCRGLLFMTRFLASPSEDKASRRCVRRNTNLKPTDVMCVCIFRQSPSFRAENYAFEKVSNRISMRTTLHSNVNAVSRCTKFIICFLKICPTKWKIALFLCFCPDDVCKLFVPILTKICGQFGIFWVLLVRPNLMHCYGQNLTGRQDPTTTFLIVTHVLSLFTSFRDTKHKGGMQIVEPNEEKKRQKSDK